MSENIIKEICNRVLSLFKQTETEEPNAKDVACNRLRVVLMQDRTNLTPELLERMRKELVELLSKYVEMDKDALELNFDQEDGQMALMLSIPVIRAKDEAEIEAALEKTENEEENEEDSSEENAEDDEAEEDEKCNCGREDCPECSKKEDEKEEKKACDCGKEDCPDCGKKEDKKEASSEASEECEKEE